MRIASWIAFFVGGLVACYLLISLGVVDRLDGIPGTQVEPSISLPTYLSFISVMLTAVTVVLAAVGIGVGVVAAYTFQRLEARALKKVDVALRKTLTDEFIKARIDEVAFSKKRMNTLDELEEGFDLSDRGER